MSYIADRLIILFLSLYLFYFLSGEMLLAELSGGKGKLCKFCGFSSYFSNICESALLC